MRALQEDPGDILAVKLVCLVLGVGLMLGGVLGAPSEGLAKGLVLIALGAYLTAASAVGLRDGEDGWNVFAPAGATALMALAGLSISSGALPA
jgi:hypothetical protein